MSDSYTPPPVPPTPPSGPKRLVKSQSRVLFGVCGGLAEYFNIDPTLVRLLFVIFVFIGVPILVYLLFAIIMPDR